jgi:hypothetical protein
MSTMLYHENPPLRNEAPVDLATTSPMPGRSGKVSELIVLDHEYASTPHEDSYALDHTTTTRNCRGSASYSTMLTSTIVSSLYRANPLIACSGVLSGQDGSAIASSGFPGRCFAGRAELHLCDSLPCSSSKFVLLHTDSSQKSIHIHKNVFPSLLRHPQALRQHREAHSRCQPRLRPPRPGFR